MDNIEVASNCSYSSDSVQSNASSLSGLSLYGNEFAELRHLVNPSKYPQATLERSSTPTPHVPENLSDNAVLQDLKYKLQQSFEVNERLQIDFQNVEKSVDLRYSQRVENLLRSNRRLEGELECANNQINRLLKGRKTYNENSQFETEYHEIRDNYNKLQDFSAKIQAEKNNVELENRDLKITLAELATATQIKDILVKNLKEKISAQHIELQHSLNNCNSLKLQNDDLNGQLSEIEKTKLWYKGQLSQCQSDKAKLSKDLVTCHSQLNTLKESVSKLEITLSEYKCEVDKVRLQALQEKTDLLEKLENLSLEESPVKPIPAIEFSTCQNYHEDLNDVKEELSAVKVQILFKDSEIEKLHHENSTALSKCIVMQKTLQQKEGDIEALESRQKELVSRLEHLKESEKEKLCQVLQLRSKVAELEVELSSRNAEKADVEQRIEMVREQFMQFKESYYKVKDELCQRNKDVLKLEKDKQEMFMTHSWSVCELEKVKHKDAVIDNLKKENEQLKTNLEDLNQKFRTSEFQNLNLNETVKAQELKISEINKQLADLTILSQEKDAALNGYNNSVKLLEARLKESGEQQSRLEEEVERSKSDLSSKDLALSIAVNTIEQLQAEHKKELQSVSSSSEALQKKYLLDMRSKDETNLNLTKKLKKLEGDWQSYLKRVTDDQKAELLLVGRNPSTTTVLKSIESYVVNFFDSLNTEEFESCADIRLKYLDERLKAVVKKSEQIELKLHNSGQERVRELEVLLQVRDRDMKEKQLKMDRNNRTLLRKVKEHMRGRNTAEKHLKYLQDLYNDLAEEHNTLKLSLKSKDHKLSSLEEFCQAYKAEIDKLKRRTSVLEEQLLVKTSSSVECETKKGQMLHYETLCGELQLKLEKLQVELNHGSKKVEALEVELCAKSQLISQLSKESQEFKGLLLVLEDLKLKCNSQQELVKNLENQVVEKNLLCGELSGEVDKLKRDLVEARDQAEYLVQEIRLNSLNLQQTVEHLQDSKQIIANLENQIAADGKKYEKMVRDYQIHIRTLENDKHFFQRLSKDLKVALNSYVDYNKKLQKQLELIALKETQATSFDNNNSIIGKYDEECIRQLLAENKATSGKKLASTEIQGCLNKLRDEIFNLQAQISRKNGFESGDIS